MGSVSARHVVATAALLATFWAPRPALGDGKTASRPAQPNKLQRGAVPASRAWHTAQPGQSAPLDANGRPLLVLQALNVPDRVELAAHGETGGFSAEDLDRAAHVMRDRSGNEHPVDPRLLNAIYRLQVRFKAPEVRIISGYRTPPSAVATSNHGKGRAMDLVVPGASDEDVAKFARELGFAGVGVYPVSGFVHVDVREHSYFWVDSSGPGKRSRIHGILPDVAQKSDNQALQRGERSVGPFHIGGDVNAILGAPAAPSTAPVEEDDSDVAAPP